MLSIESKKLACVVGARKDRGIGEIGRAGEGGGGGRANPPSLSRACHAVISKPNNMTALQIPGLGGWVDRERSSFFIQR